MIRYRLALPSDAGGMVRLDRSCFPPGVAYTRRMFDDLLEWYGEFSFVAEEDGNLAGFAIGAMEFGGVGRIITIDISPGWRRRGVGTELMRLVEKELSCEGAERIFLEVSVKNVGAVEFYQLLGYRVLDRVEDYYGVGGHALVMVKSNRADSLKNQRVMEAERDF